MHFDRFQRVVLSAVLLAIVSVSSIVRVNQAAAIDFARDIQPILSQNCYVCHGPDEAARKAELRLDRREVATDLSDDGAAAIVPGHPEKSELLARITSDDPEVKMPPLSSGRTLSAAQIETLRQWVAVGAAYGDHWSFRPLQQVEPPAVRDTAWVRNPIDRFVLARLEIEGVAPSPEADRETLLRRLSLDLVGLPMHPTELAEFLADDSPDAYERVVDRLLASPHFGERWGRHWLDLAHYADSDGYLNDDLRPYAYLYRDWVIDAVNRDLPFNEFTIEQLAGDLLPNASLKQKTATGFLRNSLRNIEAGVDLEEYRLKGIVDRVSTVGIGWLGLTIGCAECHSHKYDPISQREFYELFSFFNETDDVDLPAIQPGEIEQYEIKLQAWSRDNDSLIMKIDVALQERTEQSLAVDREALFIALAVSTKKRTPEQRRLIETATQIRDGSLQKLCVEYEQHAQKKPQPPATKAMTVARREKQQETFVHLRGNYRNRGEQVTPGTPAILPPLAVRGERADRLDLARWLVDPANPLTSRVTVNHIWNHLFGRGIVATADNFGAGGEPPSHPELIDWLSREFINRGWSRKALIRLIVTSSTYRQSSQVRDDLAQRDPLNILLARQARFRLEAEVLRDAALTASGLLQPKIGGPGVCPPQPAYVASISRNVTWEVSAKSDVHRRGMYILFRRATPYPMLMTFDMPDSTQACTRRERSNSPLQALTLLNDPVFFECAQALGKELAAGPERSFDERLRDGFQRCLSRNPRPAEVNRLRSLYEERHAQLATDTAAVQAVLGDSTAEGSINSTDQATWVLAARVLMNLDEFVTRE